MDTFIQIGNESDESDRTHGRLFIDVQSVRIKMSETGDEKIIIINEHFRYGYDTEEGKQIRQWLSKRGLIDTQD